MFIRERTCFSHLAFLCWLLQNWNKYVYSWRGIDWHCYGNNKHAILDNEPVCGNLDLQLKVVQRDRIKFVHFGLYLDINIKVVKPPCTEKYFQVKRQLSFIVLSFGWFPFFSPYFSLGDGWGCNKYTLNFVSCNFGLRSCDLKSNSCCAPAWFWNHLYDFRPSWEKFKKFQASSRGKNPTTPDRRQGQAAELVSHDTK